MPKSSDLFSRGSLHTRLDGWPGASTTSVRKNGKASPKQSNVISKFVPPNSSSHRKTEFPHCQDVCPPREVRNFRVMMVEDARAPEKTVQSQAQLTVWDVLSLSFAEGQKPGTFKEGQRFVVSTLSHRMQHLMLTYHTLR
jgi:breast cancer 2 susceptibility protein